MGQSDSTLATIQGFQIARVLPNSPAHIAGLIPYFDIITAIDHLPLSTEGSDFFKSYIKKSVGKAVILTIFNLRIRAYRDVPLTPTDNWGGVGLLGCSIDWTSADRCIQNTWHIVDISSESPAIHNSDFMQQRDYIIGMQPADEQVITMLKDEQDFSQRLEAWRILRTRQPNQTAGTLLFLLFDSVDNAVKEVLLDMRGKHTLGFDVANGYLHVIPATPGVTKLPVVKKFVVSERPNHAAEALPEASSVLPVRALPPPPLQPIEFPPPPRADGNRPEVASPVSPPSPHPTPISGLASPPLDTNMSSFGLPPTTCAVPPAVLAPVAPQMPLMPPPLQFPTFPPPPGSAAAH